MSWLLKDSVQQPPWFCLCDLATLCINGSSCDQPLHYWSTTANQMTASAAGRSSLQMCVGWYCIVINHASTYFCTCSHTLFPCCSSSSQEVVFCFLLGCVVTQIIHEEKENFNIALLQNKGAEQIWVIVVVFVISTKKQHSHTFTFTL